MAEPDLDGLPSYVVEPEPAPVSAPPPRRWAPPIRAERRALVVVWRVVELPPSTSVQALAAWHGQRHAANLVVARRRFHLDGPARWAADGRGCRIRGRVRPRWGGRAVRLELELLPWSNACTELDLRPRGAAARLLQASCEGWLRPSRWADHYFDAAHAMVDELREALPRLASAMAPTTDRTAANT